MTSTVPPRDWTELHWPDFDRTDPARWIAILPLAATEQHGPHLPLGTDVMIANAYLARVRELMPVELPATFLPLQPVGISTEHLAYPGTLTMPAETALQTWRAIGESVARAGLRKLVMVTSHGGNSAAMTLVAQELRANHGLLAVTTGWNRLSAPEQSFSVEETRHGIHGGAIETSIMLARYPQHLRLDKIDATQASAEKGEQLLDRGARAFCELLADVDRFDVAALGNRPEA
jgi:creatinine amidohydrolase